MRVAEYRQDTDADKINSASMSDDREKIDFIFLNVS
jgi:hypothetical protein